MSKDLVGALMDSGYSPQEAREMMGPLMDALDEDNDLPAQIEDPGGRQQALHTILQQAQAERQPPGPQAVVPSGVVKSLPHSRKAHAVRVDTEDSYRTFRASAQPEDDVDALSTAAQDELMGDFDPDRGYASQIIGAFNPDRGYASQNIVMIGSDQTCVLCGVPSGTAFCANCAERLPEIIGLFDRGYASQDIVPVVGFGERGAAASLYDDNPSATIEGDDDFYRREAELSNVLGSDADEFYRLSRMDGDGMYRREAELSTVLGQDGFYRLQRMSLESGGLSALIGDVMALSVPSTVYAEEIPLTFHNPDMHQHVSTWKQGGNIYGSIRVTGWDGRPRILTGATSHAREVGIVVGYSSSASVPPTHMIAVLDPLARQLGASRLLPRLAAAAPAVLRVSSDKAGPVVLTAMPTQGSWV
jgi:hypothetical protein